RTRVRRAMALVGGAGVAVAFTLVPGTAHASVQAEYVAEASADARYTGPTPSGVCALTSAPGSDEVESTPTMFSHGTKQKAVNLDATFASPDNSADTVRIKGHLESTLSVKRAAHKDLADLDLKAGGTVKVSNKMSGSACQGSGQ